MAERTTNDPAAASRRAPEDDVTREQRGDVHVDGGPVPLQEELRPEQEVEKPGEHGIPMGDQGEGGAMPEGATPDSVAAHDLSTDGLFDVEGPSDQRADTDGVELGRDVPGLDDLDDLLGGGQGVGGLDGRNPAGDAGHVGSAGEEPDFGDGGAIGHGAWGLEGAAGKLPPHQQAVLDKFKQDASDAAANGDFEGVNDAAAKTEAFLKEIGASPAGGEEGGGSPYEVVTSFGSGQAGPKQVWNAETGEVEIVGEDAEVEGTPYGTETQQMKATGTAASSEQEDGQPAEQTPPPDDGGLAEDRTPESGAEAPNLHQDFFDAYREHKWEADQGSEVNPNPMSDGGAVMDGMPDTDPVDMTAEYEEGYVPNEADLEDTELDSGIEEQFMDL